MILWYRLTIREFTNQTTRNVVARFFVNYRDVVEWKASIIVISILNRDFFIIISEFQLVNSYAIISWINFKRNGIQITRNKEKMYKFIEMCGVTVHLFKYNSFFFHFTILFLLQNYFRFEAHAKSPWISLYF